MSKADIVVVGSCNIDFTLYTKRLPNRGETVYGDRFMHSFGGKGGNQCIAAAKLGASTALIARLGDDHFGREYLNLLKEELHVNADHVILTKGVSSGVAQITVAENEGDNYILIVEGANGMISSKDIEDAHDVIKDAGVALFQGEIPLQTTIAAMKYFKEKSNALLIFNPSPVPDKLDPVIFNLADILVANETEASLISEQKVNTVEDAFLASQKIVNMGVQIAIITVGSQGAVFSTKDSNPVHVTTTPILNPVDPTVFYLCYNSARQIGRSVGLVQGTREVGLWTWDPTCQRFHVTREAIYAVEQQSDSRR